MPGSQHLQQFVRVDVTYDSTKDVFELCYQEDGQAEPTVLRVSRGNEDYLAAAIAAMRDCTAGIEDWHFSLKQGCKIDP